MEDKPENGQAGAEVMPVEVTPEMVEVGALSIAAMRAEGTIGPADSL